MTVGMLGLFGAAKGALRETGRWPADGRIHRDFPAPEGKTFMARWKEAQALKASR